MLNEVAKLLYHCTYLLPQPLTLLPLKTPPLPLPLLLSSLALLCCYMSTLLVVTKFSTEIPRRLGKVGRTLLWVRSNGTVFPPLFLDRNLK